MFNNLYSTRLFPRSANKAPLTRFITLINPHWFILTKWRVYGAVVLLLLSGCDARVDLAPVVESTWQRQLNYQKTQHRVMRGETFYGIAFHYDQDYKKLAKINNLYYPYELYAGQIIYLLRAQVMQTHASTSSSMHLRNYHPTIIKNLVKNRKPKLKYSAVKSNLKLKTTAWLWPMRGKLLHKYAPLVGKKGIDIIGSKGDKIHAARAGVVAYAGNGLAGYGNLIIIKHDKNYLTAYSNNSRNFVKEGQQIRAGGIIAEAGIVNKLYYGVHFEIRRDGKPINPLDFLQ